MFDNESNTLLLIVPEPAPATEMPGEPVPVEPPTNVKPEIVTFGAEPEIVTRCAVLSAPTTASGPRATPENADTDAFGPSNVNDFEMLRFSA